MSIDVTIKLSNLGADTGPSFNLFSDLDGFITPFELNVAKTDLIAGYKSSLVPYGTSFIRAQSLGLCANFFDMAINGNPPLLTLTSIATQNVIPQIIVTIPVLSIDNGNYDIHANITGSIKDLTVSLDDPLQTWVTTTTPTIAGYGDVYTYHRIHFNNTGYDRSVNILFKNDNQLISGLNAITIFQSA